MYVILIGYDDDTMDEQHEISKYRRYKINTVLKNNTSIQLILRMFPRIPLLLLFNYTFSEIFPRTLSISFGKSTFLRAFSSSHTTHF